MKFASFLVGFVLSLAASGQMGMAQDRLNVVATTGMIADVARAIGGEQVAVTTLMQPGIDPHAYRQTRSDIVAMARADLVLWNGLYLEAQMEDFLLELGQTTAVVAVAENLDPSRLIASQDYEGRFDPHIWMDPAVWADAVGAVQNALTRAQPEQAAYFATNAQRYLDDLDLLNTYAQTALASIPPPARVLVTAHDAFGYFGAAYGFDVVGIQGISTESEAGLRRISDLVQMLVDRDIRAVFVETSVSDRNIRALIEGAAALGHDVVIGGELFSDAMGPTFTYEGTYIGMIDHNVTTITQALGGRAPERGMTGRLGLQD
jgi:manganese/zinc/iron transport system substrate-binding protein